MSTIQWKDMDFGCEQMSLCGICGIEQPGCEWYWRKGSLTHDIICEECSKKWEYDCEQDAYKVK